MYQCAVSSIRLFLAFGLLIFSYIGQAQLLFEQTFQPIKVDATEASTTTTEQAVSVKQNTLIPQIKANTVWQISGVNTSDKAQLLVIEIGTPRAAYGNRVNQERGVLPGPFKIILYPNDFKTSKGSPLVFTDKTRVKVFTLESQNLIKAFQLTHQDAKALNTLYAFDLGPEEQAVWQGFEAMSPSHPLLVGNQHLNSFSRLSLDPLIRDGIAGIEKIKLPLPNGKWRLHLWTEDVGYWQTLPEVIERRIRINGENREYQLNPP